LFSFEIFRHADAFHSMTLPFARLCLHCHAFRFLSFLRIFAAADDFHISPFLRAATAISAEPSFAAEDRHLFRSRRHLYFSPAASLCLTACQISASHYCHDFIDIISH
jgi:hypothetical protein